jgi:hypothetical protein
MTGVISSSVDHCDDDAVITPPKRGLKITKKWFKLNICKI